MHLSTEELLFLISGIWVNLQYTICAMCCGVLLGTCLTAMKISNITFLRVFAQFYTSIFRGTPMLIQLYAIYYGVMEFGLDLGLFVTGVLAFSLNSAAYVSEIMRAGVNAVDKGQIEAAKVLGIPRFLTIRDIVLPQALRNSLPPLVNELVSLNKETAIISVIGVVDIFRRAQTLQSKYYSLTPFLIAGACYYVVTLALTSLGMLLEKRFHKQKQ